MPGPSSPKRRRRNEKMNENEDNNEQEPLKDEGSKEIKQGASKSHERIKVFGFDVSPYLKTHSVAVFISFALCHIFFSVIFAGLQEIVNSIEGFKFTEFMTLVQTGTYTLCAFIEMKSMGGALGYVTKPHSPLYKYGILSIFTFSGMFFTNAGLSYVSYPTRIIFKAGKPLPTMGIEIASGRRFPMQEIINVLILTSGITLFCFGEAKDLPSFEGWGILFMSIGVLADAITSNYEKKYIFNAGTSHAEAMFWASAMGTIWSLITLVATDYDKLLKAISFCVANPNALIWLVISSLGGYLSVVFIMLLIKCFSPTYTECVKGVRKVISIAFSYLVIGEGNKTFNSYHGVGLSFFMISTVITVWEKIDRKHIHLLASQFMNRSQILSRFMSRSDIRATN